ncbi:S-adenosylmethionine:tRNA ribosyltransferase-isomerase [invertebrate metagenome]|uniref:S-adenosylmethionine:tRNA ribosyltransferase-isomerase n=1 Tax=invertebrate metagenome TaxID=1711999 RepID=A0A484H5N5_9ZZZZ
MLIDLFDFHLPQHLIADRPVTPRHAACLLEVTADGRRFNRLVWDLPSLLRPGDVLVVNNTRVIPARLLGHRGTVRVEIMLHRQEGLDRWRAFARPAHKLMIGQQINFDSAEVLTAIVIGRGEGGDISLQFDRSGVDLLTAFIRYGHIPLPPYIQRPDDVCDYSDYQTMFAQVDGAVAAPTAGLHFTPALLAALESRGVELVAVTLHVGAGTFLPVRVKDSRDHVMHAESGFVSATAAETINQRQGRVVAVGTTSLRLLESAATLDGSVQPFASDTALFITPGYTFRVVDMLLTNFHLPRSTPFILAAAFAGLNRMRVTYAHAIAANYRFYSYGDACLLHRNDSISARNSVTLP